MAPGIALTAISSARRRLRVLDPMMGSGTVLAVARAKGHQAFGADLDPLAVLISRVWTTPVDRRVTLDAASNILAAAKRHFKGLHAGGAYPSRATEETRRFVRYWFDPYARRQLASLALKISRVKEEAIRNLFWCAFSCLIITKQAGASLAMDLSHSRPHKKFSTAPIKPFNRFLRMVERVLVSTIAKGQKSRGPKAAIYEADARELPIRSSSIDLVLTSPPYLNAIDYMRCSKFSLVWMGHSVEKLRSLRGACVGTEIGADERQASREIVAILNEVDYKNNLDSRSRSILLHYILDMKNAMAEAARVLTKGGRAIYVVGENTLSGTYIRTSAILQAVGKQIGFKLIKRTSRILPANRRYLPPPRRLNGGAIDVRMRREVIVSFRKQA
jgi:DNA modification methylase